MSWRRANSPGWASFDLKHRQERDGSAFVEPFDQIEEEKQASFSPITHSDTVQETNSNYLIPPTRSFLSLLSRPADTEFPPLPEERKSIFPEKEQSSTTSTSRIESDISQACTKLKEIYNWADKSLMTDILAAVEYDINRASDLMAEMVSSDSTEQTKDANVYDVTKGTFFQESAGIENFKIFGDGDVNYVNGESSCGYISCGEEDSDKALEILGLVHWKNVPAEPEWEEDDIYFIHRQEALHMMRSASQHSRKATDAYLRGDHFSAQQLSARAKQEWAAAEKLNSKAAKEILSIRNNENSLWKLDLHGLHALEAVQALQERLHKLEALVPSDRSLSPDKRNSNNITSGGGILRCSSFESLTYMERGGNGNVDGKYKIKKRNVDGKYCELSSLQQRRGASLHVITGIGNHSRGEAALPTAVRNFLNENGYRYDDARPGLITVRPKFRHKR